MSTNSTVSLLDCMEGMKQYPDKYFDLAVVDPPYGIGESGDRNASRSKKTNFGSKNTKNTIVKAKNYKAFSGGDLLPPDKDYFIELSRVSKNQIIWGANHFIQNIENQNSSCWLVWDKENGESDFADCELAWSSFNSAVRRYSFRWSGMLQGDMKNKEFRIHPTQKPVSLYDWIFKNYAQPGMKILDTHLGSGSSRISAHKAGMDFTAFELDPDYFEAQEKRFQNFISQGSLFTPAEFKPKENLQAVLL